MNSLMTAVSVRSYGAAEGLLGVMEGMPVGGARDGRTARKYSIG